MITDGTYTAVVDRIEDGLATLQLEQNDTVIDERTVEETTLPEPARHADAILRVELVDETITSMSYDEATARARKQAAQDRFDRLSSRPPRQDDERASRDDDAH